MTVAIQSQRPSETLSDHLKKSRATRGDGARRDQVSNNNNDNENSVFDPVGHQMATLEQPPQQTGPGGQGPHHSHAGISTTSGQDSSRLGDQLARARAARERGSLSADGRGQYIEEGENSRRSSGEKWAVTSALDNSSNPYDQNTSGGLSAAVGSNGHVLGTAAPKATGRRHHRRSSSGSDSGGRGRPGSTGGGGDGGASAHGGEGGDSGRGAGSNRSPRRAHPVKIPALASPGLKRRSRASAGSGAGGVGGGSGGELGSSDSSATFSPSPTRERTSSTSGVRDEGGARASGGKHASAVAKAVASSSTDGGHKHQGASASRSSSRRNSSEGTSSRADRSRSGGNVIRSISAESNSLSPPPPKPSSSSTSSMNTSLEGNHVGELSEDSLSSSPQRDSSRSRGRGGVGEGHDLSQSSSQGGGGSLSYAAQASPISRAAAAAARGGGNFTGEASNNGGNSNNTVTSHTRQGGEQQHREREWGEGGDRSGGERERDRDRRERSGERRERSERRRPRPQSSEHENGNDRDGLMRVRGGKGGPPNNSGSSGGGQPRAHRGGGGGEVRERRSGHRERGPRVPGGQRRRAGGRGLPRGRPTGRSGRGRRRSASMPGYRPGAIGGLAPVVEEDELDEDEEEEPDTVDPETVFKVVNKDTGEIVGDLRQEPEPVPYDVLPAHFRPSEAWHPEQELHAQQAQALAAAASPLDLAGAEKHSRRAGARKGGGSKAGSRFKSMFRQLKPRDHKYLDEEHLGQASSRPHHFTDTSAFKGGGGVVGFSVSTANDPQQHGSLTAKDHARCSDALAAEAASMAAANVPWPKNSRSASDSASAATESASGTSSAQESGRPLSANDYVVMHASTKASAVLGVAPSPAMAVPITVVAPNADVVVAGGASAAIVAGERGASPLPNGQSGPRSSPNSGERSLTRQEMAAAQVAKRKATLQQRSGLLEDAFFKAAATRPGSSPKNQPGTDSIAAALWGATLPGASGTEGAASRGLQSPPVVTAFGGGSALPEETAAGHAAEPRRRSSASAIPEQNSWDAAILHSEQESAKRRSSSKTPHKQHASHHHHHGGSGSQRQIRATPSAAAGGGSSSTGAGHNHSHRTTATGNMPSAPSNNNAMSEGVRGSAEINPPMGLTIDASAGPPPTGKPRRHSGHSGEESPPPAGRRGGELQLSPGFRELANTDWDNHTAGPSVPSGAGGLSPRILGMLSPRRGGGDSGGAAIAAAAATGALDAVKGMKLLQNFRAHTGAVWCAEFSRKGQYLATGGADGLVKIWHIGKSEEEMAPPARERGRGGAGGVVASARPPPLERSDSDVSLASVASMVSIAGSTYECQTATPPAPSGELVIGGRASRVLRGHNGDVVDLSWSPNAFLLSAGRDGSLRLWHPGRLGCVHLFAQTGPAAPTSCAFHPRLENSFATAGEDGKIRVWKITSAKVEAEATLPKRATHVRFSPDGKALAAGMASGHVRFLTSETLQPIAQMELRSSRKQGGGVSSIAFKTGASQRGEVLVGGANGLLRLYRIEPLAGGQAAISAATASRKHGGSGGAGVSRVAKFKGHINPGLPIRSSVSEDGRLVACGSEDGSVHVWYDGPEVDSTRGPARPHVSFDGTTPIATDNDCEESLSPTDVAMIRSPSLSPQGSPTRAAESGRNSNNAGSALPAAEAVGNHTQMSASATTLQAATSTLSAARGSDRDGPNSGSPPAGPARGSTAEGASGSKPRRRSPFGKRSPVAKGRGAGAVTVSRSMSSAADTSGSGAAVTLALFVPKVAMARFEEANSLSGQAVHPPNQGLRLTRTSSKNSQARRRAGIPAIAEASHGDERTSDTLWGSEEVLATSKSSRTIAVTEGTGLEGYGTNSRNTRNADPTSIDVHAERDSGALRSSRHAARGSSSNAGSSRVAVQRRGSAGDAPGSTLLEGTGEHHVGEVSVSPPREGSRRTKKRRGSDGDQPRAPRKSSAEISPSKAPPPVPASMTVTDSGSSGVRPTESAPREGFGPRYAEDAIAPPPAYMEVTLQSGESPASSSFKQQRSRMSQRHQQSALTSVPSLPSPPPAYDPAAHLGWTKEDGNGSRRPHGARGGHHQSTEEIEEFMDNESGARGSADAAGGARGAGARVVHVDVYRRQRRGDRGDSGNDKYASGSSRRDPEHRRRKKHGSRQASELSISSPSPSPSPSPPHTPSTQPLSVEESMLSPIVVEPRARSRSSSTLGATGARGDPASKSGRWSWQGTSRDEVDMARRQGECGGTAAADGSGNKGKDGGGGSGRFSIPSNSLLVSTDSLGYVRIYAKDALLEALGGLGTDLARLRPQ